MPSFAGVLEIWFGAADSPERGRRRRMWFSKSDAFDAEVRRRFQRTWESALRGALARWETTPLAALALVIVLDQFPRNMFRGTAQAFASDAAALALASSIADRKFDRLLAPVERWFAYLPFVHAEDLAAQRRSLALFRALDPYASEHARRHHDIIARFGRFPHRNAILNRESTSEELEFLKQPGSSF